MPKLHHNSLIMSLFADEMPVSFYVFRFDGSRNWTVALGVVIALFTSKKLATSCSDGNGAPGRAFFQELQERLPSVTHILDQQLVLGNTRFAHTSCVS